MFDPSSRRAVALWLCRGGCGTLCELNPAGEAAFNVFSDLLRERGEPPMDTAQILWCHTCDLERRAGEADRARQWTDRVRDLLAELRAGSTAVREREIVDALRRAGVDDHEQVARAHANRSA